MEDISDTQKPEEIPECMIPIKPKLEYELDELFPKFQPFDEFDTFEMMATKLEAHRIWKNSLVSIYPVVENKEKFLDQVMTIYYAFHQNRDSNRLGMEYTHFRNDILKRKIIDKVTHTKIFAGSTDGVYSQAFTKGVSSVAK